MSAKKSKKLIPETNSSKPSKKTGDKKPASKKQPQNNRIKNANTNGFKQNPENINKKGRPPLLLTHILQQLKKDGYDRVTASQVAEAYEVLFNLDQEKITAWTTNITAPMFMRIVAKAMLSPRGVEMIEKMLDRAHGKSIQKAEIDHKSNGQELRNWTIVPIKKDGSK